MPADLRFMLGHCELCWYHIGLMLSHFGVFSGLCWPLLGKRWDHTGLTLGHFGLCLDILGHVVNILGSCLGSALAFVGQAMLGHFGQPHWAHVEPF